MANKDDTLLKQLESKHPDYREWEDEWIRYRDVVGDGLVDKEDYLPRNSFEPQADYDFRVKVSQFIPESGLAIEKIIGALYDEKPRREFSGQESIFSEFIENADRRGNSWNDSIESICHSLLSYGTTRILINVPPVAASPSTIGEARGGVVTRATEKKADIRPFVIDYNPLAVTDWEIDEQGILEWVRIREESFKRSDDDRLKPAVKHLKFIEYDKTSSRWWIFRQTDKSEMELTEEGEQEHGLGIVPMVVASIREIKGMIGHSFVRYSSRADVQKTQAESDQAFDTYLHAHPMLKIHSQENLASIGIGTNTYIKLNPGVGGVREDAEYIEAPDSAFEAIRRVIEDKRTQIYRLANTDPMGILEGGESTFQASGVARAWSFGTSEGRILSKVADKMEQIEQAVFELVVRLNTLGEGVLNSDERLFKGTVQYPEEFDMSATSTLIDETERISQQINSPTLIKLLHKRIAASKVGETTSKELEEINKEIEENPLMGTMAGQEEVEGGNFNMPSLVKPDDDSTEKTKRKVPESKDLQKNTG